MLRKTGLVYVCEDHGILNYDDFSKYCFENHSECVWRVFDGVEYCHAGSEEYLAKEYKQFRAEYEWMNAV